MEGRDSPPPPLLLSLGGSPHRATSPSPRTRAPRFSWSAPRSAPGIRCSGRLVGNRREPPARRRRLGRESQGGLIARSGIGQTPTWRETGAGEPDGPPL